MARTRSFLVAHDGVFRDQLSVQLAQDGNYEIVAVRNSGEAHSAIADTVFLFAIIDQGLAEQDGALGMEDLRETGFDAPILLLADASRPPAHGGLDRITKPFRFD